MFFLNDLSRLLLIVITLLVKRLELFQWKGFSSFLFFGRISYICSLVSFQLLLVYFKFCLFLLVSQCLEPLALKLYYKHIKPTSFYLFVHVLNFYPWSLIYSLPALLFDCLCYFISCFALSLSLSHIHLPFPILKLSGVIISDQKFNFDMYWTEQGS